MRWTAGRGRTISARMANRLLLTLLALLTGLAAQLVPAQARVCAEQTSAVAVISPLVARVPAAPVGLAQLPGAGRRNARLVARNGGKRMVNQWHASRVYIQIDRARE